MAKRRIHFEDQGQDFLWWDIDEDDVVVDCGPFQGSIWIGTQIIDDSESGLIEGDRVLIEHKYGSQLIKYPIERIEIMED